MNKIGYAVFGRPRGHVVKSYGLFKELDLDNSLYLKDAHIILNNKEQVIMVRRIPTNLNDLDNKDGYLVVLYEHGLQQLENRAGGYVGSAICFKENAVDATKLAQGLFHLFTEIKKHVDVDNRFKSTDGSDWKVSLPDPNGKFGILLDEKLHYSPMQIERSNISIKLNNIQYDILGLITHFCLNQKLHHVDYLYASNKEEVVSKLKSNGIKEANYSSLFNYNETFKRLDKKLQEANYSIKKVTETNQKEIQKFEIQKQENEKKISALKKEGRSVLEKLTQYRTEYKQAKEALNRNKDLVESSNNQVERLKREVNQQKNENVKELKKLIQKLELEAKNEKDNLQANIAIIAPLVPKKVMNQVLTQNELNGNKKIRFYINEAIKANKRNKLIKLLLAGLLLISLSLLIYNSFAKDEVKQEKTTNGKASAKTVVKNNTTKDLLLRLNKYDQNKADGLEKHQENVHELLQKCISAELTDEENEFVSNRQWNYWELYYKDSIHYPLLKLVHKELGLNRNFKDDRYLLNINPDSSSFYIEKCNFKLNNIEESFKSYIDKSKEEVFNIVPEKFRKNKSMSRAYFEIIIKELNDGKLSKDSVGHINVLYIKVKK